MAFGKALVLLLAALAVAVAQHDPIPDPHDPAYDPFFHPTGRPKQNALAGATSQQSPGFPEISKLLPLVQADTIGPNLNTATTKVVMAATWDFGNPSQVRAPAHATGPTTCGGGWSRLSRHNKRRFTSRAPGVLRAQLVRMRAC